GFYSDVAYISPPAIIEIMQDSLIIDLLMNDNTKDLAWVMARYLQATKSGHLLA
ncbi:10395_t:CDS:2, partial [Funneliformis geosporum]